MADGRTTICIARSVRAACWSHITALRRQPNIVDIVYHNKANSSVSAQMSIPHLCSLLPSGVIP